MADSQVDSHRIYGFTDEQLATLKLSWRPGLFDGQVVLVSGAGTGLGKAIAYQFGRLGAKLVICGRKADPLERTAEGMRKLGIDCLTYPMTIRDPEQVAALFDAAWSRYGRLDVLVNNAGLDAATPLLDPDWSEIEGMWALNYFAPWRFTQAAWQQYLREHGGSVVNIASTAAAKARPIMAAYGMTKAALCDLTRRMAIDVGPGVRVNCIAPGVVDTEMLREVFERHGPPAEVADDGRGPWPLRRAGTVQDVAAAALYLASDASGWVTGQVMYVDGGASLL